MAQYHPSRPVLDWIEHELPNPDWLPDNGEFANADAHGRSSLEDILQHGVIPEPALLPESSSDSSAPSHDDDAVSLEVRSSNSSMQMFESSAAANIPLVIPLPDSRPSSMDEIGQGPLTYAQVLKRATTIFPHIMNGNARWPSRIDKTSLICYDYYDNRMDDPMVIENSEAIPPLQDTPEGLLQRVVVVEDLSETTIHALGSTFNITPEFFEEHLLNSGYRGAQYDDAPALSWKTAEWRKPYTSLQWFRPVYRLPPFMSPQDRRDLLEGRMQITMENSRIMVEANSNIFRSEWNLQVDPQRTPREAGLVERISIWRSEDEDRNCEISIVLVDPLPAVRLVHNFWTKTQRRDNNVQHVHARENTWARSSTMRVRSSGTIDREWHRRAKLHALVEQTCPRKDFSLVIEKALMGGIYFDDIKKELEETQPTARGIDYALAGKFGPSSLVGTVFEIMCKDTMKLLQILHAKLNDIDVDLLDEAKMEGRLPLWREMLSRSQRELMDLKGSLERFLLFFNIRSQINATEAATSNRDIATRAADINRKIDQTIQRLQVTSDSLTSNMGLLESRQSIEETHAVTRLTELAFLFIPLSFSTSVFGMQIKPFEDHVPISRFFIVAVVSVTFAYMMRLTTRSHWVGDLNIKFKSNVRQYAEQHGRPVSSRSLPALLVGRWLCHEFQLRATGASLWMFRKGRTMGSRIWRTFGFPIGFLLAVSAVAVAPLTVLWTRKLDKAVQVAITVVIVLVVAVLVGIPYWRWSTPEARNALPNDVRRFISRLSGSEPGTAADLLIVVLFMVILVVVPLALVWTRPLPASTKAALTVAVLILFTIGIIFILLDLSSRTPVFGLVQFFRRRRESNSEPSIAE